jgi:hypothetical protein
VGFGFDYVAREREAAVRQLPTIMSEFPDVAEQYLAQTGGFVMALRRDVASSGDARSQAYARIRAEIARHFGGSWDDAATRVLADIGEAADGWTYSGDVLTCPCGHVVEDDGSCPHGHVSPFRAAGLV